MSNNEEKVSFLTDLNNRRVPQFIGLYLAIAWGFIQFISWVADRYLLSPYLVDLSFAVLLSMIPSIIILSYFHGKPGKDHWNGIEKVFVPANFIISTIVIFIMFYPKDLGAITKDIVIEDENGETITKTIIKSEFKKNIIIWDFENKSNNDDLKWLETSFPSTIGVDLAQDYYIVDQTAYANMKAKDMGFSDEIIPLKEKKKLADYFHADYFATGNYDLIDDVYFVELNVYKVSNLKVIHNFSIEHKDIFSIIDELSLNIKEGVGISQGYLDNIVDLPITEIFTNSFEAFKNFSRAMNLWTDNDIENAIKYIDKAVEIDNAFAYGHFLGSVIKIMDNDIPGRIKHLEQADKYSSKLPERYTFPVKIGLLDTGKIEDHIRRQKVLEMWLELHPNDRSAYDFALQFAFMDGDYEKVIIIYKKIIEINPSEDDMLIQIGSTYETALGDDKKALEYYKKYEKRHPSSQNAHKRLAYFYRNKENYQKADDHFLKASTYGEKSMQFDLKYLENSGNLKSWDMEEYLSQYEALQSKYTQPADTLTLITEKKRKVVQYGKLRDAIEYVKQGQSIVSRVYGGLMPLFMNQEILNYLADLEDDQTANDIIDMLEKMLSQPPLDKFHYYFKRVYYQRRGDIENLELVLENSVDAETGAGIGGQNAYDHSYCYGLIQMHKGNYEEAIKNFEESIALQPTANNKLAFVKVAQCYNQIGEMQKAEKYFTQIIDIAGKNNPEINYYYALFLEKNGNYNKAKELIDNAYGLYKDADKEYSLAQNIYNKYEEYQNLP